MDGLNKPTPYRLEGDVAENWRKFRRDYELFMVASGRSGKSKNMQAAILLNLVGPEAMELYETFDLSDDEENDPDKILQAFENHAKPQINETYERFVFNRRERHEGETIEHYVAELKKLAKTCNYDTLTESMIRDNIIQHMDDTNLQQTVLKIKHLELETLIENIKAAEVSRTQVKKIQNDKTEKAIVDAVRQYSKSKERNKHQRRTNEGERRRAHSHSKRRPADRSQTETSESGGGSTQPSSSGATRTFRCRKCDHRHGPRQCPAYGKQCTKCQKYNHSAKVCRSSNNNIHNYMYIRQACNSLDRSQASGIYRNKRNFKDRLNTPTETQDETYQVRLEY